MDELSDWILFAGAIAGFAWYLNRPRPASVADRIVAAVLAGGAEPFAAAGRLSHPTDRGEALWLAHRRLDFEERPTEAFAALRLAAEAAPELYLEALLEHARTPADREAGVGAARALLAREPHRDALRARVAEALVEGGRPDEALELLERGGLLAPELRLARASVLAAIDRDRDALAILDELSAELAMRFDADGVALRERAATIADGIHTRVLGAESRVILAGRRGALDPSAGENFRLLGAALMARSGRIASTLRLQAVEEDDARAKRLTAAGHPSGPAFASLCRLREGRTDVAVRLAQEAFEAHRGHFPLALVLGAARVQASHRAWRAAESLPDAPLPEGLEVVVPDLPALTEVERRVVAASAAPLRAVIPLLAERGVTLRILPLDVRPTDLPELAHHEHAHAEDGRAVRAIGGLATHTLAASRIEDLLDTVSPEGWVFAHELAHLALFHLPERWQARVAALRERAEGTPWSVTEYARSNDDELFAVSYVGWLQRLHERPHAPVPDADGVLDEIHALFSDLARARAL